MNRSLKRRALIALSALAALATTALSQESGARGALAAEPAAGSTISGATDPAAAVVAAATASGACAAERELAGMDDRIPVPLLPRMADHQKRNMRDHLLAVQEIVVAAAAEDFAGIERAAGRIGYSAEMGRMCGHMGAGAPGFTGQALQFHHTADTIASAARERDLAGVMRALSATLGTCTTCHATFRQSVVDQAEWRSLVGQSEAPAASPARRAEP